MSEAPAEAAEAAPVVEVATTPEAAPADKYESAARDGGWKPKEEFEGNPENWVDAETYVLNAAKILPDVSKQLREAKDEIKGVKKAVSESAQFIRRAEERAYKQARADLEAEFRQAVSSGDVAAAEAVRDDLAALDRGAVEVAPQGQGADFAAWRAENGWYGEDKPLSAAFDALCEQVREEGYATPKVGLKEATRRLQEEYPHKFAKADNPNRRQPGAVEGQTQRRATGRGFSDMSPEAREMCVFFEKSVKGFSRDKYVRDHFEGKKQ